MTFAVLLPSRSGKAVGTGADQMKGKAAAASAKRKVAEPHHTSEHSLDKLKKYRDEGWHCEE